ncbi:MBL fold metallo-hydrolase [Thermofilum pendens]|uniref:Metal-dependent hydrolases of the beta-lactamase superfamily II-like protein n=1 Tax=Thermofilum pendens (strain DSM 2475 / Hrk 5) TaxID=368408 RepID=A1RYI6_THEPD|nr:hypothetical protein [Thermofilum pendens]ABL78266.1 Metal-dependent hydrolases of the beta-lactamase superfamily II-like protein [Thermofilum pendens Hrk 5]
MTGTGEAPVSLTLKVLVDDVPSVEGVVPAHGLSILVEARYRGYEKRLLFDAGPSGRILLYNAKIMGVDLKPDFAVGSLPLYHHVGGFKILDRRIPVIKPRRVLPEPREASISELPHLPGFYLVMSPSHWNEQALMVSLELGAVLITGCSVHGFYETFGWILKGSLKLYGLVGGLGISTRDFVNMRFLRRLARGGLSLVFPLHSTSLEARRSIVKTLNKHPLEYDVPGAGAEVEVG